MSVFILISLRKEKETLNHSTETTLLKVYTDILSTCYTGVSRYVSCINHEILLTRM